VGEKRTIYNQVPVSELDHAPDGQGRKGGKILYVGAPKG